MVEPAHRRLVQRVDQAVQPKTAPLARWSVRMQPHDHSSSDRALRETLVPVDPKFARRAALTTPPESGRPRWQRPGRTLFATARFARSVSQEAKCFTGP